MELHSVTEILLLVDESLSALRGILAGQGMLTAKSQKDATELLTGAVPSTWAARWEGPATPTQWIRVLNKKAVALLGWVKRMQQGQLLQGGVDLGDLFHPETFLNALRQKSARRLKLAIDELKLVSSFETDKLPAEGTVRLDGLWLQGSEFDGRRLVDLRDQGGTSAEVVPLPPCCTAWVSAADTDPYPAAGVAEVPVYHALDRERLLCTLKVCNTGDSTARVLAGVALFLAGTEA